MSPAPEALIMQGLMDSKDLGAPATTKLTPDASRELNALVQQYDWIVRKLSMRSFQYRQLWSKCDPDDIAALVWMQVVSHHEHCVPILKSKNAVPFLRGIIRHCIKDVIKHWYTKKRNHKRELSIGALFYLADKELIERDSLPREPLRTYLEDDFDALPDTVQRILELRLQGKSNKEIGALVNTHGDNVRKYVAPYKEKITATVFDATQTRRRYECQKRANTGRRLSTGKNA